MVKRENVIWVIADQLRQQALGCYGDENARTPNIDQLASVGLRYTRAYSGFPLCCPFRGSMLTSRYPHSCVPGHEFRMPEEYPTIATAFTEAGYRTAYFGKWHVDGFHESEGRAAFHTVARERRGGFETWLGYDNNNIQWDSYLHGHDESGKEVPHFRLEGYETDVLTDLFLEYMDRRAEDDEPFFAVLSVQPPHDPYVAPADYTGHFSSNRLTLRQNVPVGGNVEAQARRELAGYYAQIENLDANVGRLVERLHERGLYEKTHILFFSDHGDMHGSQGLFRKTVPYQEAVSIPFVLSGTRSSYGGYRTGECEILLNHVDIAPTTLGLCGIEVPSWMEGRNLCGPRFGTSLAEDEPDSVYLQSVVPTGHKDSCDKPYRGIITSDGWKYVCFEGCDYLLFDLNEDPCEMSNLAHNSRYALERKRLRERLRAWVEATGDRFDIASWGDEGPST